MARLVIVPVFMIENRYAGFALGHGDKIPRLLVRMPTVSYTNPNFTSRTLGVRN